MKKIFNENEWQKLSIKDRAVYCESYEVKYWIVPSGKMLERKSKMYYAASKGATGDIQKKWNKEYKGKNAKIISINYQ